jgi:hypothetical protein
MKYALGLPLFALLTACVNTDPAVFVTATLGEPALAVSGGSLGTSAKGGFTLKLHLGARASGPSTVQLQSFSVVDTTNVAIIDPLKITTDKVLPVTVAQDSDVAIACAFDTGANPLPKAVKDKLCAGQIQFVGTFDDSLENTATSVESVPFQPTGCP